MQQADDVDGYSNTHRKHDCCNRGGVRESIDAVFLRKERDLRGLKFEVFFCFSSRGC